MLELVPRSAFKSVRLSKAPQRLRDNAEGHLRQKNCAVGSCQHDAKRTLAQKSSKSAALIVKQIIYN